jgi:hypothetical protein
MRRVLVLVAAAFAIVACNQASQEKAAPSEATMQVAMHRSDILFRRHDGLLTLWSVDGTQKTGSVNLGTIGSEWSFHGMADFNGDGNADLLWRRNDGVISIWTLNGGAVASREVLANGPDASWDILHVADYNGDGRADILFRNAAGTLSIWCMNGASVVSRNVVGNVGPEWGIL